MGAARSTAASFGRGVPARIASVFRLAWLIVAASGSGLPVAAAGSTLTVIAGSGSPGFADGEPTEARFNKPIRLAPYGVNSVLVADIYNHAIRIVTIDGEVSTLTGGPERKGYLDGAVADARFDSPHGVAVASDGRVAVAEASNHTIRLLQPTAGEDGVGATAAIRVSTLAGLGGQEGFRDGPAHRALFSSPHAVAWIGGGGLLVADIGNARIRRIQDGLVTTVAGGDGKTFVYPMDLALGPDQSILVADAGSHRLIRVHVDGDTQNIELDAELHTPHGVTVAADGTIYVADMRAHQIVAVDRGGHLQRVFGTGGPGHSPEDLNLPAAVLVHAGRLWIADLDNHRIVIVKLD